jgi:hypothetical protein
VEHHATLNRSAPVHLDKIARRDQSVVERTKHNETVKGALDESYSDGGRHGRVRPQHQRHESQHAEHRPHERHYGGTRDMCPDEAPFSHYISSSQLNAAAPNHCTIVDRKKEANTLFKKTCEIKLNSPELVEA